MTVLRFALPILALLSAACADKSAPPARTDLHAHARANGSPAVDVVTSAEFAKKHSTHSGYWNQGLAELNRYSLQQSRYGELHDGEAVFVFVTEPFLKDRQVKFESGDRSNAEQVLKLNAYRRFYTGVYPYTTMTSTFVPANRPGPSHKLTTTVQEWCGQVFAQLNLRADATSYGGRSFSYFQSEGDREFEVSSAVLEDALPAQARRDLGSLPIGTIELLPSTTYLRLAHKSWDVRKAQATLSPAQKSDFSDSAVRVYRLEYVDLDRVVEWHFEEQFPHRLVGWEETARAIFNPAGGEPQLLTTRGKLTSSIMLDYWSKHGNDDAPYRDALGLKF